MENEMAGCRFENTATRLKECIDALSEAGWESKTFRETLSDAQEQRGFDAFIVYCENVNEALGQAKNKQRCKKIEKIQQADYDPATFVVDLLTDLRHYCHSRGIDINTALQKSTDYFGAELK